MKLAGMLGLIGCVAACGEGSLGGEEAGAGEAVLAWDAPSTDSGGGDLTDLAGYRVYYGTDSAAYNDNVDVADVTEYRVSGLQSGVRYYFAVTAYDTSGNESLFSNEVSKDID